MATRHLVKVILDNKLVVAEYGSSDGYLSCAGHNLAVFFQSIMRPIVFKRKLREVSFFTQEETDLINKMPDSECKQKYPHLYGTKPNYVLEMIQSGTIKKLYDSSEFGHDDLFCEWIYSINLDKKLVSIYNFGDHVKTFSLKDFTTENVRLLNEALKKAG